MGKREFTIYLDPGKRLNRYRHRHRHVWQQGNIVEFRIQYEALIEGKWHTIVRYDSAHGNPHKDTLHPNGSETKEWFTLYSNAEVLTIGQRDIIKAKKMLKQNIERVSTEE